MVCFIILHYMAYNETLNCVDSILNNVYGSKKIIIVDNCSPNKSGIELKKHYHLETDVDVIFTSDNLGFAKGNNYGYYYALRTYNPEFIIVMNNDMEIKQNDIIDEIYNSYDEYKYHIMGPDIYSTKKKYHQNPQRRAIPTYKDLKKLYINYYFKNKLRFIIWLKWFIIGNKNSSKDDIIREDPYYVSEIVENPLLHGSCYIFSKDFINMHPKECFYDKTFMYMEAEILYYLANINHEKMIYNPSIKIEHHEDVSTDAEYKKQYKKSIFSVKCLLQSSRAFLDLMDKMNVKEL